MDNWIIYDKEGREKYVVTNVQYREVWMGEEYIMVTFTSPTPMDIEIGDWMAYRGCIYTVYNVPSAIKQARSGSYGDAFKYENVKLSALSAELSELRFHDVVLNDNLIHYTSLPSFSFYAATVDDLVDRLQANTDRIGTWLFITPSYSRTMQRYEGRPQLQEQASDLWDMYFAGNHNEEPDYEKTNINISVDKISAWDAVGLINTQFGLNFFTKNRVCIIGANALSAEHVFLYGKGNGLTQIERTAEADQQVVTKVFAYGSDKNLPTRYYAELYASPAATVIYSDNNGLIDVDIDFNKDLFVNPFSSGETSVSVEIEGTTYNNAVAYINGLSGKVRVNLGSSVQVATGTLVRFVSGVNKGKWPEDKLDYTDNYLPNNMAVNMLMLPGFPKYALGHNPSEGVDGLCYCEYIASEDKTRYYIRKTTSDAFGSEPFLVLNGNRQVVFSTDRLNPYIISPNAEKLGIKEGDIHFTEENDDNGLQEIYPSIEGVTAGDVFGTQSSERLDEIRYADMMTDNGVGTTMQNFNITLKNLGFDLYEAFSNSGKSLNIEMKDGYCGGRSFNVAGVTRNENGTWRLNVERLNDDALDLWFPYSYNASIGEQPTIDEAYQLRVGDHFVLTGIDISDTNYVWVASVKMLKKAIVWLLNNDYTRFAYSPKVDNIFMARQHDAAIASGGEIDSLYDTLKAGQLMNFEDADFQVYGSIFVESITITEDGTSIPKYEITLRNDKQVGTFKKLQNQVNAIHDSIVSGGGMSLSTFKTWLSRFGSQLFLSKTEEDTAEESIGFLKGFWVKAKELFGIDADGNAKVKSLVADDNILTNVITAVRGFVGALQSPNFQQGDMSGTGWRITDSDENGHSKMEVDNLLVRMKFIANVLEARKYVSLGGNYVYSPASSVIEQVDYYDANGDLLGYDTIKVPWLVRMVPLLANTKLYSRSRTIKRTGNVDMQDVVKFRCWIKADDGTTKTVNTWQVGMLARCQTMDVSETEGGTHTDANTGATGNRLYWREVTAKGQGLLPITDGLIHSYVDLSNASGHILAGSDAPLPGDSIVCYGATVADYSNIIEIETVGSDAPAIKEYRGVGLPASGSLLPTFSTEGKRKTMISPASGNEFHAPRFVIETTNGDEELYNAHFVGHAIGFEGQYTTPANGDVRLVNFPSWTSTIATHQVYSASLQAWVSHTAPLGSYFISDYDNHRYLCTSTGWVDIGLGEATKSFKLEVVGDAERAVATSMGMQPGGNPATYIAEYVRSSTENISRLEERVVDIAGNANLIPHTDNGQGWNVPPGTVANHIIDCDGEFVDVPDVMLEYGKLYTLALDCDTPLMEIGFRYQSKTGEFWSEERVVQYDFTRIGDTNRYYYVIEAMTDPQVFGITTDALVTISLNITREDACFPSKIQLEEGDHPTDYVVKKEDTVLSNYSTRTQTSIAIRDQVITPLGVIGFTLNGQQSSAEIQADKFSVIDSQGEKMMGMDADTDEFTVSGTIKADNFFNHVAYGFEGGEFADCEMYLHYKQSTGQWRVIKKGDSDFRYHYNGWVDSENYYCHTSGKANVLFLIPLLRSNYDSWTYSDESFVLPPANLFEGKIIDISCQYKNNSGAYVYITSQSDDGKPFGKTLYKDSDGHIRFYSDFGTCMITAATSLRLLAAKDHYDNYKWVVLSGSVTELLDMRMPEM